jgi:phosphoglycolate phosphatase-like HAD superfamily hydrolase
MNPTTVDGSVSPISNRKPIVLFDWDGTLIKSLDIKVANAARLFQGEYQVSPLEVEAAYRRHSGIPRRQLFEAICADLGLPALTEARFTSLSQQFTQRNRQAFADLAAPAKADQTAGRPGLLADGCPAMLETLHKAGCMLYVSSSADLQEIQPVARMLALEGYFLESGGEILGSRPGFSKGPEHIRYALERAQVARAKLEQPALFFVGDEPADIRLGRQGGAHTIAISGTYPAQRLAQENPGAIVASLTEIPGLVIPGL